MRNLLKLGLMALALFVLAGCGGGGGSSDRSDEFTRFLSNLPKFDTSGYTLTNEYKDVLYYDNSSTELAKAFNATMSEKDVTLDYEYYSNENDFYYVYELNDLVSKDLDYSGVFINGRQDSSFINMWLEANRSISNSEFANLFGRIDAALLARVSTDTIYNGNMSAKFAEYYADVTGSGEFFDISDTVNVRCDTDDTIIDWWCEKYDMEFYYRFYFYFNGTDSYVSFGKESQ
jgi:hypothetical protein